MIRLSRRNPVESFRVWIISTIGRCSSCSRMSGRSRVSVPRTAHTSRATNHGLTSVLDHAHGPELPVLKNSQPAHRLLLLLFEERLSQFFFPCPETARSMRSIFVRIFRYDAHHYLHTFHHGLRHSPVSGSASPPVAPALRPTGWQNHIPIPPFRQWLRPACALRHAAITSPSPERSSPRRTRIKHLRLGDDPLHLAKGRTRTRHRRQHIRARRGRRHPECHQLQFALRATGGGLLSCTTLHKTGVTCRLGA